MDNPVDDYIIHFLSRQESAEDIDKLKNWLAKDPANKERLKEWLQVWDATDMVDNFDQYNADEAYHKFLIYLKKQESEKSVRTPLFIKTIRYIGRIAAIFILGFSLGTSSLYFYKQQTKGDIAYVENIVPLGSKSEIILPDGSKVWLNAGSKLRYPTNYGDISRDIFLEGEGYFKVAKKENKTFTVHTALMSIRALGTEFNVKAYPEEEMVETTLISGEVAIESEIKSAASKKSILLKPGQKYSMRSENEKDTTASTQTPTLQPAKTTLPQIKQLSNDIVLAEVSWKEKNWRIEKENLQSLAQKLERRYNVRIQVDDKLMSYHFTGTLKDESLEQVLRAMQSSAPILYTIEGKEVTMIADPKKMK